MTITFQCKLLTPLFLTGAEKNIPEIRPSSIKGALRWWWRAMNGNLSLDKLQEAEAEIFGSVDKKSPLVIRTSHPSIKDFSTDTQTGIEYIHNDMAKKYLLFSQNKGMEGNEWNRAFRSEREFQVTLTADESVLENAVAAFWLFAHLGGLGTRSRRGGGNFMATISNGVSVVNGLDFEPAANEHIEKYLERNIQVCLQACQINAAQTTGVTPFSTLSDAWIVVREHNDGVWALGDIFKAFRSDRARTGDEALLKKAAFGLPLTSKMPTQRNRADHTEVVIAGEVSDRRASPIMLRELEFDGQGYWLACWLKGQLFPADLQLRFINSKSNTLPQEAGSDIYLTEFMQELTRQGGKTLNI